MSVIVYVEHSQGSFRKKSFESVIYAAGIAKSVGGGVTAVVAGTVSETEIATLGEYGAIKVLHYTDARLDAFSSKAIAKVVADAARKENATVVVALHDTTGKAVASRVAAQLMAGMVAGAISYPDLSAGFVVKRNVFSGKAFANVNITSAIKVVTLMPNTFGVAKSGGTAEVVKTDMAFDDVDFAVKTVSVNKATGDVPLSEAELVVSGGRGMKGPENWHVLEALAKELGAATACSRPVADALEAA